MHCTRALIKGHSDGQTFTLRKEANGTCVYLEWKGDWAISIYMCVYLNGEKVVKVGHGSLPVGSKQFYLAYKDDEGVRPSNWELATKNPERKKDRVVGKESQVGKCASHPHTYTEGEMQYQHHSVQPKNQKEEAAAAAAAAASPARDEKESRLVYAVPGQRETVRDFPASHTQPGEIPFTSLSFSADTIPFLSFGPLVYTI